MLDLRDKACPKAWQPGGQAQRRRAVVSSHRMNSSTTAKDFQEGRVPLALQVFKRNRWCTVGKVTFLEDQRIFAIAHDQQAGVQTHLSIPELALDFAKCWGCTTVVFWRRADFSVRQITLADLLTAGGGYWGECVGNDAIREWYFPIAGMTEAGLWARPKWEWASEVLQLQTSQPSQRKEPQGQQLELFAVAGVT